MLSRLAKYIDWFELSWSEWVVNYDFAHQVQMAQTIQRSSQSWTQSLRAWFERAQIYNRQRLKTMQLRHGILGLLLPVLLILLLVALRYDLIGKTMRRLRLYWHLHTPESPQANPLLASRPYAELLPSLERHGPARRAAQTPLEFALRGQTPTPPPAVSELAPNYSNAPFRRA